MGKRSSGWSWAALGLSFLTGLTVTAMAAHVSRERAASRARRPALLQLLAEKSHEGEELRSELAELRRQLRAFSGGEEGSRVSRELSALRGAAGLDPVEGPGVVVALADSPLASRVGRADLRYRVQDVDLQRLLNQVWALGAEAIALNGERVAVSTAVRMAGNVILVGTRPVASPYEVQAVGDPEILYRGLLESEVGRDLRSWSSLYGIKFEVKRARNLRLEAAVQPPPRGEGSESGGGQAASPGDGGRNP